MREQSVISRVVRVAAGVFAPGHLGELTQVVPFELVDAVLGDGPGAAPAPRAALAGRGVFPAGDVPVSGGRLSAGLGQDDERSGGAARRCLTDREGVRDLRRRVGGGPMRALFEVLCGPLARPVTPGVRFGPYRMVSFDGCSSLKVPDTGRNRAWLDRPAHGGYPQLELMTLVKTGTRAMIGAVFGPTARRSCSAWPTAPTCP